MDRPRLFRGLRIAVSAVFGVLCVLLIALRRTAPPGIAIYFPYWFLVFLFVSVAALPWIRWRFQPPHSANRHDACRGRAGADCGVWTLAVWAGFFVRGW